MLSTRRQVIALPPAARPRHAFSSHRPWAPSFMLATVQYTINNFRGTAVPVRRHFFEFGNSGGCIVDDATVAAAAAEHPEQNIVNPSSGARFNFSLHSTHCSRARTRHSVVLRRLLLLLVSEKYARNVRRKPFISSDAS